jgi:IS4 transposase
VYAFWGFTPPKNVKNLSEQYRRRFGIESSYRQLHQARARTSTRSPLVRLFLVGVAVVLRNVWVWLTGLDQAANQKSRRRLARSKLTLKQMLHWLQHLVEETFGVVTELETEHPAKPIVM